MVTRDPTPVLTNSDGQGTVDDSRTCHEVRTSPHSVLGGRRKGSSHSRVVDDVSGPDTEDVNDKGVTRTLVGPGVDPHLRRGGEAGVSVGVVRERSFSRRSFVLQDMGR